MKLHFDLIIMLLLFIARINPALAQRNNATCEIIPGKPLTSSYGPFDYTDPRTHSHLPIVLNAHFVANVERLIKGNRGSIIADIDYTLRAIPNYHRALYAMAKYQRSQAYINSNNASNNRFYTADCYFKRAIYLQPKDSTSRMLYAMHLQQLKQYKPALTLYQQALTYTPQAAELNYNYGLLLVKMKKYKLAKAAAAIAYNKGYPLMGLKNKLAKH